MLYVNRKFLFMPVTVYKNLNKMKIPKLNVRDLLKTKVTILRLIILSLFSLILNVLIKNASEESVIKFPFADLGRRRPFINMYHFE